jgi:superfamily II DNA/RNA helicase
MFLAPDNRFATSSTFVLPAFTCVLFITGNSMTFNELNLIDPILSAITEAGYTTPTPIQEQAIPEVLAGHDVIASAQTGTGKTAAFVLPALHKLAVPSAIRSKGPRVLVLTPTRELAQQINEAVRKYGKNMRLKTVCILGGMPYPLQNKLLSQPVDILVATPGRLIDHLDRGRIDFSRLEILVLDEADRMLDMGFIDDVERIAAATPETRQTLLFSATMEGEIAKLAQRLLKSPKRIAVASQQARHEQIEQRLHYVDDMSHKNRLLDHLLRDEDLTQAIVFTATKRDADSIAEDLYSQGHAVAALHGDMNQGARNRTLTKLRSGGLRVLVATDVAARGIDVSGISHVINYDLPKFAEDYVHRIGRTGRAGASGIAVSFASGKDQLILKRIERFTGQEIPVISVPGHEPKFKPRSGPPNKGGRSNSSGAKRPGQGGHARNDNGPRRGPAPSPYSGEARRAAPAGEGRRTGAGGEGRRAGAGAGGGYKGGNTGPKPDNFGNRISSDHGNRVGATRTVTTGTDARRPSGANNTAYGKTAYVDRGGEGGNAWVGRRELGAADAKKAPQVAYKKRSPFLAS